MSSAPDPGPPPSPDWVSRGAEKLRAALDAFALDVTGLVAADLGCSTGGFTDCLLRAGAKHVFAVDTAYGQFAWRLRQDPRVTLMERTNALHVTPPGPVDLVVIDLGWTRQRLALPAARRWLPPGGAGRIITLVKPHYEIDKTELKRLGHRGVLPGPVALEVVERVQAEIPALGFTLLGTTPSPLRGNSGNAEWLALLAPSAPVTPTPGLP
jgi:23S rRNA (cytidine1920-2'-O)/16S rRNA (cytidine1409-2'-O)-methyltransferase